jgi:hypothetical protein
MLRSLARVCKCLRAGTETFGDILQAALAQAERALQDAEGCAHEAAAEAASARQRVRHTEAALGQAEASALKRSEKRNQADQGAAADACKRATQQACLDQLCTWLLQVLLLIVFVDCSVHISAPSVVQSPMYVSSGRVHLLFAAQSVGHAAGQSV